MVEQFLNKAQIWAEVLKGIGGSEGFQKTPYHYLAIISSFEFLSKKRLGSPPPGPEKQDKGEPAGCLENELREVLFLPEFDRPNCLGICKNISEELGCDHVSFLLNQNIPEKSISGLSIGRVSEAKANFKDYISGILAGFRIWLLSLKSVGVNCTHFKNILRTGVRYSKVRRFLKHNKCKVMITPNERLPSSAIWVAAASSLGMKTICFLHGAPTKIYAPVYCDEFWSWGRLITKGVFFDAPNVKSVGAMEFCRLGRLERELKIGKFKTLLIIAQLGGDDVWGIDCFHQFFVDLVKEFRTCSDGWIFRVRMHPNDPSEEEHFIRNIFAESGLAVEISRSRDLLEDIREADTAFTVSSTAILPAFISRIPSFLYWVEGVESIFGPPFLPERFVVSKKNISKVIQQNTFIEPSRSEIESVMGDYKNSVYNAASILKDYIELP